MLFLFVPVAPSEVGICGSGWFALPIHGLVASLGWLRYKSSWVKALVVTYGTGMRAMRQSDN